MLLLSFNNVCVYTHAALFNIARVNYAELQILQPFAVDLVILVVVELLIRIPL